MKHLYTDEDEFKFGRNPVAGAQFFVLLVLIVGLITRKISSLT
jgi:hypothetical protein